jgi:hypothetical protein
VLLLVRGVRDCLLRLRLFALHLEWRGGIWR